MLCYHAAQAFIAFRIGSRAALLICVVASINYRTQVKLCQNAGGVLFAVKICRCGFPSPAAANAGRRGALRRNSLANDRLEALKKEISIMKRLDHPNIVKLHYILEDSAKGKVRITI